MVVQLGSRAAALNQLADAYSRASRAPVRKAGHFVPFKVPGVPVARGWDYTGNGSAAHNAAFADGPFFYLVGVSTGPKEPSRRAFAGAVQSWYERVHALH